RNCSGIVPVVVPTFAAREVAAESKGMDFSCGAQSGAETARGKPVALATDGRFRRDFAGAPCGSESESRRRGGEPATTETIAGSGGGAPGAGPQLPCHAGGWPALP